MNHRLDRRKLLAAAAATGAAILLPAAALAEPVMGDIVMGNANAPVTVIEYASFTCPHCARFAMTTFPEFKKQYIDTGKVKFILREVYFDQFGLWASMTARCGGASGFYPMAEQFLTKQDVWAHVPQNQIAGEIQKIGRMNGLSSDQLKACLTDQKYAKALIEAYKKNAQDDDVKATPTFLINGEKYSGEMTFAEFSKLVDAKL